jgi:2-dehydro-3-deoxyphosphogluconate aldolase/(4S)-4-hydroxy-2-oxoglutarate aldolase
VSTLHAAPDAAARPEPLLRTRLIAILRAGSAEHLDAVAHTLVAAGVECLELTLTTPGALEACARLREALPVAVGMGSVTTADEADAALDAGAAFLVTPTLEPAVIARPVPVFAGAFSPTELLAASRAGASAVKLFPAFAAGPKYLRAAREPLPDVAVIPTGGIAIADIAAWLDAGAAAVGLGGPLIGDALAGGDLTTLAARARAALRETVT